jgi:hypothetical protein
MQPEVYFVAGVAERCSTMNRGSSAGTINVGSADRESAARAREQRRSDAEVAAGRTADPDCAVVMVLESGHEIVAEFGLAGRDPERARLRSPNDVLSFQSSAGQRGCGAAYSTEILR